ncbi:MAG TPA: type IV pilin protein [Noviherbaspirillum sp.]|uniref:type IV pilin protein n=1 Tax=Pseudoxanthomonas sp. CF125 TaxID=1855303 RepID=UPI00087DF9C7|nr:type IV pilin protein [Pseudoxanthomonas sp. CF125]SDQ49172.1 type IV pilus assembly protein PilE [Pseudoxanthomonas sp. CF125]HVK94861.1 type IV pilin protein [Noviherbaspirillum sp.]
MEKNQLGESLLGGRTSRPEQALGFTLIELMIVVAVVAVLVAIAYPSYQDALRKSRRAQAKADLIEYAALAERFRTVNNTYVGFTLPVTVSPREAGAVARYNLTPAAAFAAANSFTITATAAGDQANDRCGNLTLSNTGVKGNSAGALADCW